MVTSFIDTTKVRKETASAFLRMMFALSKEGLSLEEFAVFLDSSSSQEYPESIKAYMKVVKLYKKKTHITIKLTFKLSGSLTRKKQGNIWGSPYESSGFRDVCRDQNVPQDDFEIPIWEALPEMSSNHRKHGFSMIEY